MGSGKEEEITECLERAVVYYSSLESLDLSECRLSNQRFLRILGNLPNPSGLRKLNVEKNFFRAGIYESIERILPNLKTLEIERDLLEIERDLYVREDQAITWEGPSQAYELFQKARMGYVREYQLLQTLSETEDPLAMSYFSILLVLNNPTERGLRLLADSYVERLDLNHLRNLAIREHPEIQNNLGMILGLPLGRREENRDALYFWCRRASENGFSEADFNLGVLMFSANSAVGVKYCEKAALKDNPNAVYKLVDMYASLKKINPSRSKEFTNKAASYLRRAGILGHLEALYMLGGGCEAIGSKIEMLDFYQRAAAGGHEGAILRLQQMRISGERVPPLINTCQPRDSASSSTPPSQWKERNYLEEKQRLEERFGFGAQWQEEDKRDFWSKFIQLDKTTREAFKQKWDTDADNWIQLYPALNESERLNFFQGSI